jgi:UDP-glucose 4-epimerase
VSDVVGALIDLAESPKAAGEVFNIGSGNEITILDLAKKIKELTSSTSEIVFVPYDQAYEEGFEDMQRRVPDTRKLREITGYQPKFTLEQTLERVIDHISKA